jgi:GT2 family glycosyltransferase
MRILLGIPTGGHPTKQFLDSLGSLALPASCTAFDRHTVTGNFVPAQRELIARRAIAVGADYLFMVDDDIVVPTDALLLLAGVLAEQQDAAVAAALYYTRDGIRPMAADGWNSNDTTTAWIPAFDRQPLAVDAVGFACVLVRVSALRMLAPPFFGAQIYIETNAARVRLCNEDFLLCERLRQTGYRVILHPDVRCGHVQRDSGKIIPEVWENAALTNRKRMVVALPGPHYALVDYDPGQARALELHETATLTYVSVE